MTTIDRLTSALADRYRVERELGAGGMATVYLAEDLKHHRQVAIKVLRPDLAAALGPDRFMQEIEIAARLQHPHILGVHDSGSADGFLYYVMPYVEGESLRERLSRQGELPIHEAVRLLSEVADALAHAHSRGVVHRDIKPENVMVSGRHALVMDFGVAKAVSEASGRNKLTTLGVALGTPAYMAPEQASADPHIDHRVDIYALGVMGYELLAGRPPFTGASPQQVLAAHVMQRPELVSRHRPSISPALASIIMKALEKRPADRWQTAEEMLAQLEPLATPSGGLTPTETRPVAAVRPRTPWPMFIFAGAGVIGCVALVFWLMNRPPAAAVITSNTQLTRAAGIEENPTISPDGRSVAYRAFGPSDSAPHVEFRRTDGGDAVQIAGGLIPRAWSPSGDRLLMSGPRGLVSQPALGGQGTTIDQRGLFGSWSPDGKQVAFIVADSLFVGDANGGTPRFVTSARQAHSPAWSPDGKWIAFVSGNVMYFTTYNIAPSNILLVSPAGGAPIELTPAGGYSLSPTWVPDSRRLLVVSVLAGVRDVYQLNISGSGHLNGEPVRITTGLNPSLISLSADGTQLAYSVATYHANIWKVAIPKSGSVSTQGALPVTNDLQTIEHLDVSHDGKWLLFDSNRQGVMQIFRMPLGGGPVQQLTHDSANPSFHPAVSPDGQIVAFNTIVDGRRRVFSVPIDGGRSTQLSPGASPDERNPAWSPDGHRVAWVVDQGPAGYIQVAARDAQGKWGPPAKVPAPPGAAAPMWVDQGAVIGVDSTGHLGAWPTAGGAFRQLNRAPAPDPAVTMTPAGALSSDGQSAYILAQRKVNGQPHLLVVAMRLADGEWRDVLRFDEQSRPHSVASLGVAEYNGWLYFTLSDFQADVWVASVKGLKK